MRRPEDSPWVDEDPFLVLHPFMWEEFELQGTALLVYARIFGFCKGGGSFYESRSGTARFLGVSERSVIRAVNQLEERGLIEEVGEPWRRDGFMTRNYALACLPDSLVLPSDDNLSPPDISGAARERRGDMDGREGVPDWHLKSKE